MANFFLASSFPYSYQLAGERHKRIPVSFYYVIPVAKPTFN